MLVISIASILGAVLYRLGGTKHGTLWRDAGMPIVMMAYMAISGHWNWWLILCAGLVYGSQTTYNKWAHRFFLKGDSNDVKGIDWFVTGLSYCFAMLPYSIAVGNINGFLVRGTVVTLFTFLWSEFIGEAWIEESGRGFIQIVTLPLLV